MKLGALGLAAMLGFTVTGVSPSQSGTILTVDSYGCQLRNSGESILCGFQAGTVVANGSLAVYVDGYSNGAKTMYINVFRNSYTGSRYSDYGTINVGTGNFDLYVPTPNLSLGASPWDYYNVQVNSSAPNLAGAGGGIYGVSMITN